MRGSNVLRFGLVAVMAVLLAGASIAPAVDAAATKTFTTVPLATTGIAEWKAETDGNQVAYMYGANVALHNLTDGTVKVIDPGDTQTQQAPDLSQGRMIFEQTAPGGFDVHIYDSWLDDTYPVASTLDSEWPGRISGNLAVWRNYTKGELWYRDLARDSSAQVPDTSLLTKFDVDRGRIFWTQAANPPHVYVFEPGISTASRPVYVAPAGSTIESLRAYGDWIAVTVKLGSLQHALRHSTENDVVYYDISNSKNPSVWGDAFVYEEGSPSDITWYRRDNIGSSTDTGIVADQIDHEFFPAVFGNRVVYGKDAGGANYDLYMATMPTEVDRTEGTNRYLTAVEASKAYFHASDNAVLCTGLNFPDALAAGPLARLLGGPLLLTKTDSVSTQVIDELDRLEVKTVFIIGGTVVVSDAVVTQLEDAGYTVERIAGNNRYTTSVAIAEYMDSKLSDTHKIDMAFFARGDNFPDALAVGPVAAGALSPIILVKPASVSGTVAIALDELDVTSGVIVGGHDVVSTAVLNTLKGIMIANGASSSDPVDRWAGDDRYATAIEVVKNGVAARWIDLDTVGVATGRNFPDALGGGAALGHYGSPILLVKGDSVPSSVSTWVKDNKLSIGRMDVFGGPDVVSDSVKSTLTTLIN